MANTATAIYIDTYGSGSKQTGHPEFELSEAIGFSPFTIEMWYKHADASTAMGSPADWTAFMSITNTTAGPDNTTVSTAGSDFYLMGQYGAGQNYYSSDIYDTDGTSGGTINSNDYNAGEIIRNTSWHHFAVTREFGKFAGIWHDGVLIGGADNAYSDRTIAGKRVELGFNRFDAGNYPFKGYMDEVRISKTVRYGNIDMPTTFVGSTQTAGRGNNALRPEHVSLLIQSNSTVTTSDKIVDRTGKNTVTVSGCAYTQNFTQFGNCSIYFDGANQYHLEIPRSDAFDVSDGQDFSFECWFHRNATGAGNHSHLLSISADSSDGMYLTYRDGASPHDIQFLSNSDSGDLSIYAYPGGTASTAPMKDTWNHVACGKVNGQNFIMLNGQLAAHGTQAHGFDLDGTAVIYIGRGAGSGWNSQYFEGYMDGIRFCKGQSAYTPHFTPYGGQKNIVHNRGGAITDVRLASANTHAIQMGRAAIGSDAATNANTYCLDFDGTNDYLVHKTAGGTGTTQFRSDDDRGTIFAWIYPDVVNSHGGIFSAGYTADTTTYFDFYLSSSAKLGIQQREGSPAGGGVVGDTSLTATTWQSVAVVSDGTAWALYVNGTAQSLTASGAANEGEWFADTPNLNNITIGTLLRTSDLDNFDGKIMQVAYFGSDGTNGASSGVLTAAQIAALHSAGKSHDLTTATGVYTATEIDDLKGYWRMGNHRLDTARTIYDASGNGYDMHEVSDPAALTFSGTGAGTFVNNWQHRGYFTPDKYTSLLIQSSTNEGATSFQDTGPGFKRTSFDGTNDYASKTVSDWQGSDDRGTIIAWVKLNAITEEIIFSKSDTGGDDDYMMFYVESGNVKIQFKDSAGTTGTTTEYGYGNQTVSSNAWACLAWVSDGTNWTTYVNGVADTSWTSQAGGPADSSNSGRWLGDVQGADNITVCGLIRSGVYAQKMDGQMSQIAIWGGSSGTTGVLTAAQISAIHDLGPGADLTTDYASGMVGYWTFGNKITEGTDDASTIYDQSAGSDDNLTGTSLAAPFAGHAISVGNNTKHKTNKSIFGGSSMYFDGSDDSLQLSNSPDFAFGDTFTFEFWVNFDTLQDGVFWEQKVSGTDLNLFWYDHGSTRIWIEQDADVYHIWDFNPVVDRWYHVAYSVHEGVASCYVDGIEPARLNTTGSVNMASVASNAYIGTRVAGDRDFHGYLDEYRISGGIARYSKSIERFANTFVAKGDTGDAFTALQIQSNGAKNGASFSGRVNKTGFNTSTIDVAGNPIWKNTVGDGFGGANTALYFDGTSYVRVGHGSTSSDWAYGTGDFTIEFWIYNGESQSSSDKGVIGNHHGAVETNWRLKLRTDDAFNFGTGSGTTSVGGTSGPVHVESFNSSVVSIKEWHHVVFQRKNLVGQFYIDGAFDTAAPIGSDFSTAEPLYIGYDYQDDSAGNSIMKNVYMDQIRLSKGIARYGKSQLGTTQQTHVSANADSGVITSNSTFGSANNIFETDGHTVMLLNGDELYANTLVVSGAHTFHRNVGGNNVSNVTTTFATSVQASVERVGGTTGNVYTINGALRPTDLVLVRDNHYNFQITDSNYSSHPFKFSTTSGGTHSPGGTEYTTGITVDQTTQASNTIIKFSPTSATPDTLYYYCSSHNLMGGQITVTDSTGSDGKIATQPFAMFKGDGTAAAGGPTQRQGISAYGANSYFYDGTDIVRTAKAMVGGGTTINDNFDFGKEDFTIEYWEYPNADNGDHIWALAGDSPAGARVFEAYYYGNTRFNLVYGLGGTSSPNFNGHLTIADQWAHIAIQGRWKQGAGNIEIWRNGALQNTSPSITTAISSFSTTDGGSPALYLGGLYATTGAYQGYFDSWRISKGIARYGYSGTNAKLGTNIVHHSHQKLLLTSNTFNGNTHFDDFSDQGNYWNAQPTSIWSDGYLYAQGGTDTSGTNYFHTGYRVDNRTDKSFSYWVFPEYLSGATDDYHLVGANEGSAQFYLGFRGDGRVYTYVAASSETMGADDDVVTGQWQLLTIVQDGTDISAYVNGEVKASASGVGAGNDGTVNFGLNSIASGRYKIPGRVSQLAIWEGKSLSASEVLANWQLGPDANWVEDTGPTTYANKLAAYYTMGNHNNLGGRPADTTSQIYDRSGNGLDSTAGATPAIAKGIGSAITNQGSVKHSTDIKNFGSSALRFPGANPDYLTMPDKILPYFHSSDWTIESWIWFDKTSTGTLISKTASSTYGQIRIDISNVGLITAYMTYDGTTGANIYVNNSGSEITLGSWHHLAVQRRKHVNGEMYVDGILAGNKALSGALWDNTDQWEIGRLDGTNHYVYEGYVDELGIIVGAAKYNPVVTGQGSATITPSYLNDPTGNHFTPTGLAITDQMLDTPENNFCTLNPVGTKTAGAITYLEGYLKATYASSNHDTTSGTIGFTTGKWYWEAEYIDSGTTSGMIGIRGNGPYDDEALHDHAGDHFLWSPADNSGNGQLFRGGPDVTAYGTFTNGDIIGVAVDMDSTPSRLAFYVNGVFVNDQTDLTNSTYGVTLPFRACFSVHSSGFHVNFGQGDPNGENNYTDTNGRGGFKFEPPAGHLALCTANMKDSEYAPIGPNTAAGTPDKHFDTLLWVGNGKVDRSIRGLNFQPDLIWIKNRENASYNHHLVDSQRGPGFRFVTNGNQASAASQVSSLNSDGFTVTADRTVNDTDDYVAWCWKAGNESVVDNSGTIGVTRSTNVDAGFSIIRYAKNATAGATIAHGLGKAPEWIMVKDEGSANDWQCYHTASHATPEDNYLSLNQTLIVTDSLTRWNDTAPDANFITLGESGHVNGPNGPYIAYAWTSIEGYSKFGSYEGINNADGTFVYLGFKPAWVMIKNVDATTYWTIFDNKRSPANVCQNTISAEDPRVEETSGGNGTIDMLSNGFKPRNTDSGVNAAQTYVYIAFAEMPFKYATAR